jgi:peptide deformylase
MGLRNILVDDDPALRKPSREVINFDRRLHDLLDDLAETMFDAEAAGLAAPQVGILRRVFVICLEDDELVELVNPRLIYVGEETQRGPEGCLSVQNRTGMVVRPERVTVEAQDRYGKYWIYECGEFDARVFCHEIDHLNGIMYTDVMERFLTAEEITKLEEDDEPPPRSLEIRRKK